MTTTTRRGFIAGAAVSALTLSACTPGQSSDTGSHKKKILKFAQANAKQGLDMQTSTNSGSSSVADNVIESPLAWTEDRELVPVLFTSIPKPEDNGLTYKCELKKGVKFHDGTELKASDVKFSFERMFDPKTQAKSTYMYDMIVGAAEKLAGKAKEVEGVVVEDDYHVTFKLKVPMATFVKNLGINYAAIYPEKACTEAGEQWGKGTNLIGTGPYKLVANDDTNLVTFERFEDYHGERPNLDLLYIQYIDDMNTKLLNFKNGDTDYCDLDSTLLAQYQKDPEVSKYITQYVPLGTQFINLNVADPALKDVRVRQALSLAIDRQTLVDTVLAGAGVPASGFLNMNVQGFDKSAPVYEYNVDKAKQLLAEAGASNLSLSCKVRSSGQKIMVAIQDMWAKAGITLDVQTLDAGVWAADWAAGNLQVTQLGWYPLFPDGDNQIYTYFYSENAAKKSSFYNNPTFDAMVLEARQSTDEDKRTELYKQADNLLSRVDYAVLPLFYPKFQFVAQSYVKNAKVGNLIYHMMDVDIDTEDANYQGTEL